MCSQRMAVFGF